MIAAHPFPEQNTLLISVIKWKISITWCILADSKRFGWYLIYSYLFNERFVVIVIVLEVRLWQKMDDFCSDSSKRHCLFLQNFHIKIFIFFLCIFCFYLQTIRFKKVFLFWFWEDIVLYINFQYKKVPFISDSFLSFPLWLSIFVEINLRKYERKTTYKSRSDYPQGN